MTHLTLSLTTLALNALSAPLCGPCGSAKDRNRAFCQQCYHALPEDLGKALWRSHCSSYRSVYVDAWDEAREWLETNGNRDPDVEEGMGWDGEEHG